MTSADKATQACRFLVRGRVQGVGFRWFVEREAHILGIAGWVRNKRTWQRGVWPWDRVTNCWAEIASALAGPRAARG
jgi:hypothetical protein